MNAHAKKDQFRGKTSAEQAAWLRQILEKLDRTEQAVAGLVYRGLNKLHALLEDVGGTS